MNAPQSNIEQAARIITPRLRIVDPGAAYWYAQVTLRLRREVAWCWHQRAGQSDPGLGLLPPLTDAAADSLDRIRYEEEKQAFFALDPAARYLGERLAELDAEAIATEGRWQVLATRVGLDAAAQLVLAMGLAGRVDAALAPIFATCMNDLSRPFPTLALAQRLWDDPVQIVECADPAHPLYRFGLLAGIDDAGLGVTWQRPLDMPALVARELMDPDVALPRGLLPVAEDHPRELDADARLLVGHLRAAAGQRMQIVPLLGVRGTAFTAWAAALSDRLERPLAAVDAHAALNRAELTALACVAWLRDLDLVLPEGWLAAPNGTQAESLLSARALPLRWYLPVQDQAGLHQFPDELLVPPLQIAPLSFEQRVDKLKRALGGRVLGMESALEQCARRFRFQDRQIERVALAFDDPVLALTGEALLAACAQETVVELGNLAERVTPRFTPEELILPPQQARQFAEIMHAMRTLTLVHYHWGTARVWNESGLAALFCGPPGTGKTMAAEALASALDLPLYRIDLSQVVNKYIGETEKNLKRIFDAAEIGDCILFFDEADALFGKRSEVKDAHDRFANIEISYLLERMERFKGLAILATNRRKDVDQAFLRRLRYLIEFPMPGLEERRRIWQAAFPSCVDVSGLDLQFLAKQFQLSGGHIRSIAFNACLGSADWARPQARAAVTMPQVLLALKRELEKMNRAAFPESFGPYRDAVTEGVD